MDSSFQIKVQENNTGDFRESYISVSAADSTELIHLTQAPANAIVTNDALTFSNQAATAKFSITSETSWSATSSASWLQVTPENGTAGTTEVTVDVAPNVNIAERRGYITFKCNDVTELLTMEILQKGLYIEADAEELIFDAQKSNQNLQINSNVEWIITFSPQWATPSISSNHGDASINITVEENLSTYERSGFLILESPGLSLSTKVQLTQKGKPFSLGTTELTFSDKASKNTVDIITDGTWIAQCDATWLTLSPHSANGNSTLTVSVSENLNDSERIAIVSVTMSDKTIELAIRQQGKYLSVGDAQLVFPTKGGFLNLQVATNDAWKASLKGNAKWLNMSTSEGNESLDMIITATDNASVNERSEVLSITTKNNLKIELPIKQEARTLSVSASDVLFFARGGTSEIITIQTNGEFSMSQVGDWFAISRIGTNSFSVIAVKNNTKGNREGSITIALTDLTEGKYEVTIPVVQVQVGCSFTLSGFGGDSNQDNSFGDGNFSGNGFDVDLDWNASLGNAFSVGLISFVTDSNWDTIGNNTFTVTITEFQEDVNCDDKNDTSNTTLEKDNFGEENNWNE